MSKPKHYLEIVLPVGKAEVRREYLELTSEDERRGEALERWVLAHPDMVGRVRNREKTAERLRNTPIYTRIARPSSWGMADRAENPSRGRTTRRSRVG